jgi:microcompartment protein CcmL/EutN
MIESLGFVEVIGAVTAIEAIDAINRDANVSVLGKEGIGGGLVTIVVQGQVADVKIAVDLGTCASKKVGQVVHSHVIVRPHESITNLLKPKDRPTAEFSSKKSLGFIEVKGLVPAIEAADTALKSADVLLLGRDNVGLGLITVFFQGDLGSINSAIEAGAAAAKEIGEVVAVHVIPRPQKNTYPIALKPTL